MSVVTFGKSQSVKFALDRRYAFITVGGTIAFHVVVPVCVCTAKFAGTAKTVTAHRFVNTEE